MHALQKDMEAFHGQLRSGGIRRAYRALLSYIMGLRTHFKNKYPDSSVSALYQGYLDMTYFAIFPPSLKQRDLKIAIVFNYKDFRFEAWLTGRNKSVINHYREMFNDRKWPAYRVVTPAKGVDSIIEYDLAHDVDLDDTDAITTRIENGISAFIEDIERFLEKKQAGRKA